MVGYEIFVKSMTPCLSELKVTPNFCFPNKIPDNLTATTMYVDFCSQRLQYRYYLTCVGDALLGPQLPHITGNFLCGSVGQRVLSNRSITGLSESLGQVGPSPRPSYSNQGGRLPPPQLTVAPIPPDFQTFPRPCILSNRGKSPGLLPEQRNILPCYCLRPFPSAGNKFSIEMAGC